MPIESLEDVRLFRQIVASGSISAAARALGDNKNRISQRLAALERSLGTRLAERNTRSTRLTEDGERFLVASGALVEAADLLEALFTRRADGDGRVRIAIRSALSDVGFGEEIARLLEGAPQLRLQIVVADDQADPSTIVSDGIDVAVLVGKLRDSSLVAKKLGEVSYVMCASPAYLRRHGRPKTPRELLDHECIRRLGTPAESHWQISSARGERRRARIGGRLECSDARFQTEILYGGFGIGLRPASEVRRAAQAGTLERVLPGWAFDPIAVWAVGPDGRMKLQRVQTVVGILARVVRALS